MTQHPMTSSLSRRRFLGVAAAAVSVPLVGACGGQAAGGEAFKSQALATPQFVAPPEVPGALVSKVPGVPMLMSQNVKKYVDAVTEAPGRGGPVTTFQILWGGPPRGLDKNKKWQQLNKELNAQVEPTMTADATFGSKLATTLASGKIPDLSYIVDGDPTVIRAIDDGAFADLSEALSGDKIMKYPNLANVPTEIWKSSAKNGHLYGIPNETAALGGFPVLRVDLMKQVGVEKVPKSPEDFQDMMYELSKIKKVKGRRVWAHGDLQDGSLGVYQAMLRVGQPYQLGEDGKVTTDFMGPAFERYLEYVHAMWKKGVFHPDAFGKVSPDLFKTGQVASFSASFAGYYWPNLTGRANYLLANVSGAEIVHYVPPGADGKDPLFNKGTGYSGLVAISSEAAKNPERLDELLKICDYYRAPFGSQEALFLQRGLEGLDFTFGPDNEVVAKENPGGKDDGHISYLGIQQNPVNSMPKDTEHLSQNVMDTLEGITELAKSSPVESMVNEAFIKHGAKLTDIREDFEYGMIMGRKPLSAIKDLRETWLKSGGQDVLDNYNKTLEANG